MKRVYLYIFGSGAALLSAAIGLGSFVDGSVVLGAAGAALLLAGLVYFLYREISEG